MGVWCVVVMCSSGFKLVMVLKTRDGGAIQVVVLDRCGAQYKWWWCSNLFKLVVLLKLKSGMFKLWVVLCGARLCCW